MGHAAVLKKQASILSQFGMVASKVTTWAWLALALAGGAARADIYACSKHGTTTYQNFPCAFDSIGSLPREATPATPAAPTTKARGVQLPGAGNRVASQTIPPPAATAAPYIPRVGASSEEVRRLWGEPEQVEQDEPRSGRTEIWRYKDGRTVEVDRRHRVIAIQL